MKLSFDIMLFKACIIRLWIFCDNALNAALTYVHYKVRLLVSQNAAVNKTLEVLDFQGLFYLQKIRWG